jgi:hypothetical protein
LPTGVNRGGIDEGIFLTKIGISDSREFTFSTTPRASSHCFEGEPRPLTRVFRASGMWLGSTSEGPPRDQSSATAVIPPHPPSPRTAARPDQATVFRWMPAAWLFTSGRCSGADLPVNAAVSRAHIGQARARSGQQAITHSARHLKREFLEGAGDGRFGGTHDLPPSPELLCRYDACDRAMFPPPLRSDGAPANGSPPL